MTIYLTARSTIEGWSASYSASVGTAIVASETVAEAWQYSAVSTATGADGRVIVPRDHPPRGRWIRQNDYVAILAILAKSSASSDNLQTQTDSLSDAQQTIEDGLQAISDAKAAADQIVSQAAALLAAVSLADAATNQAAGRIVDRKTSELSAALATSSAQLSAKISEVETAYADADKAIAQRTSTIEAELAGLDDTQGSVKAAISDASTAYTGPLSATNTAVAAVSQRTSTIEAAYGSNSSSAIFKSGAIATASGAEASCAWSLTATAGSVTKTAGQELDVVANGSSLFSILRDISDYRTQEAGPYLFVWGDGFGVDGNLAYWFGPKMNIWECSKTNAVEYRTVTGDAYFGGALSAGTLTTKAATSSTAANAVAETAVFGSNGGTITVTMSLAFGCNDTQVMPGTLMGLRDFKESVAQLGLVDTGNGFYKKSGSDAETYVDLYRAVAGGGYSMVATITANGSYTYNGEAPVSSEKPGYIRLTETISGSLTYTDPDKSTSNRQYKAVIRTRSTKDTSGISQNLSVVCIEQ